MTTRSLAEQVPLQQEVREATEWTRWQEADKWSWDEAKRQRWAEGLWRHQQKRRIERAALRRKLAAAEARQKLEVGTPHALGPMSYCSSTSEHPLSRM